MPFMAQGFCGECLVFFKPCMRIDASSIFVSIRNFDFHVQDGDRGTEATLIMYKYIVYRWAIAQGNNATRHALAPHGATMCGLSSAGFLVRVSLT